MTARGSLESSRKRATNAVVGVRAARISAREILAPSASRRQSQAMARTQPPRSPEPDIAATVGFGTERRAR
ncbi:MAG: hypothetical protein A2V88_12725 [Elusimicrobia bacterium RBG_16_66_12]|nr:MAG: hypothetical protein A2V88_12725 [Elusimicrobia bacterium RBG_16_66_12]